MNWKIGNQNSVVVSDEKVKNTNFPVPPNPQISNDSEIDYYGGYLICESIGNNEHANLISAAPDLLDAIKYYFMVKNEACGVNWSKNPDHVQQKFLKAVAKAEGKL